MGPFQYGFAILRRYRVSYAVLNAAFYGALLVGMLLGAANPSLQEKMTEGVRLGTNSGLLRVVRDAYVERNIPLAAVLTFSINLVLGSFGTLTVPSLLIPFLGILMGLYRAFMWGILFSPTTPDYQWLLFVHSGTLLIEGQAYVLAMLAVYIHGKAVFSPRTVGASKWSQGYWMGLCLSARLYLFIVIVLGIAAIYEPLETFFVEKPAVEQMEVLEDRPQQEVCPVARSRGGSPEVRLQAVVTRQGFAIAEGYCA